MGSIRIIVVIVFVVFQAGKQRFLLYLVVTPLSSFQYTCSGFSSILSIILNPTSGFHDIVPVSSPNEFFHSNSWLGAVSAISGAIGGQVAGLLADR